VTPRFFKTLFPLVLVFSFSLFVNIGLATNTITACLDAQTAQHNVTIYNASDMSELITLTENETCNFNCSSTLNDCRWDEYTQMTTFIGIIVVSFVILVFAVWLGRRILMIDFAIYAIMMMFFALMGGVLDVFIARYQTILLVMTFVPIGFFFYSLWLNIGLKKKRKGDKVGR